MAASMAAASTGLRPFTAAKVAPRRQATVVKAALQPRCCNLTRPARRARPAIVACTLAAGRQADTQAPRVALNTPQTRGSRPPRREETANPLQLVAATGLAALLLTADVAPALAAAKAPLPTTSQGSDLLEELLAKQSEPARARGDSSRCWCCWCMGARSQQAERCCTSQVHRSVELGDQCGASPSVLANMNRFVFPLPLFAQLA